MTTRYKFSVVLWDYKRNLNKLMTLAGLHRVVFLHVFALGASLLGASVRLFSHFECLIGTRRRKKNEVLRFNTSKTIFVLMVGPWFFSMTCSLVCVFVRSTI